MFLQFSPPVAPLKKKPAMAAPDHQPPVLSLAPFTAIPKICFENVKVGHSATETLIIKNSTTAVQLSVHISGSDDNEIGLNWTQTNLKKDEEEQLSLSWTPKCVGSWRCHLCVNTGTRLNKEIPIVLKSISSTKKRTKTLPRFVAKKTPSPMKHKRKSPKRLPVQSNRFNTISTVAVFSPQQTYKGKENVLSQVIGDRRETYIVTTTNENTEFEDSLEETQNRTFEKKILSDSFLLCLTPTNLNFKPDVFSTDEKSSISSRTHCLNNETFEMNISTGTYVKNDLSTETYTKDLSTETYVKNLSSDAIANLSFPDKDLETSPFTLSKRIRLDSLIGSSVKNTIEANLWSDVTRKKLSQIKEESSVFGNSSFRPTKRKTDIVDFIPIKRLNIELEDEIKVLEWPKTKTAPMIDKEMMDFLERQEENFKKWLNAILVPSELETEEKNKLDVAKLWRDIHKKGIESKPVENVVDNTKLNAVRKSAKVLYKSPEVQSVLNKIYKQIETNRLSVRSDRDIHLDLSLQADIMNVLLSYNPLWLRIGLETIYGRVIPLRNNSDIIGLTTFLYEFFIRNPFYLKKFKSVHTSGYIDAIKKFILKKFLSLVYLLDVAKTQKIFPHDPCLFRKNAPIKESREALLGFSREILSSMGDVTKYLKHYNYVVTHKQNYLDEFDYTVRSLILDLRDGVRLTRVLEIILLEPNLRGSLRVPAISRLQKVSNTKLVFDILAKQNFELMYDISNKDIVNGHKEKTLCFLWQIIYKFQTPLMAKSVSLITSWWRSPTILAKRAELKRIRQEKEEERQRELLRVENKIIKIQSYVRMFLQKIKYKRLKNSVRQIEQRFIAKKLMETQREQFLHFKYFTIIIQRRIRANRQAKIDSAQYQKLRQTVIYLQQKFRSKLQRQRFIILKHFTIFVQRTYRSKLMMRQQFEEFQTLKATTILVQRRFRANVEMKRVLYYYEVLRKTTIWIQKLWRANQLAKVQKTNFETLKSATVIIQRQFRAKREREEFLHLKAVTILVQRRWRANLLVKIQQQSFLELKTATIMIQRRFRAKIIGRIERTRFLGLKQATIVIQRRFRATLIQKAQFFSYQNVRQSIMLLQRKWRATILARTQRQQFQLVKSAAIIIQKRFRATVAQKTQSAQFQALKQATIFVQRKWRAKILARSELRKFELLKTTCILIQRKFRAKIISRIERRRFQEIKSATIVIQQRFRATLLQKMQYLNYQRVRQSIIIVQRKWRATILARAQRKRFELVKVATLTIQRYYRATVAQKLQSSQFQALKQATIFVQRQWRAKILARTEFRKFEQHKTACILIQRKFRAKIIARIKRKQFELLKSATITIQRRFRASVAQKIQFSQFQALRQATIFVQRQWRAKIFARSESKKFHLLKTACILIQRKFRANIIARSERKKYQELKSATIVFQRRFRTKQIQKAQFLRQSTIFIQRKWRATILAKAQRKQFELVKLATIIIQRRFRATVAQKIESAQFQVLRQATIFVQRKWRAKIFARSESRKFELLKTTCILIQRKFRAKIIARIERRKFLEFKQATIVIQRRFRATQKQKAEVLKYQSMRQSILFLQRTWRATIFARAQRKQFELVKSSTIIIQRRFRATVAQKTQSKEFQALRQATIFVQRKWRAKLFARIECKKFELLKRSCILVQTKFRAKLCGKLDSENYQKLRATTIFVQRKWRSKILTRMERNRFISLKRSALVVQNRYRANLIQKLAAANFKSLKMSTIFVQRKWRATVIARIERKHFNDLQTATIIIQRRFRAYLQMKQFQRLRHAVIFIQKTWRGGNTLRVQKRAAVKIQAAWRGYKSRRTQCPKLLKVYENLKRANQVAKPEQTLGARYQAACLMLRTFQTTATYRRLFEDLDFITRRCPVSLMSLSKQLPPVLYKFISSTNRSLHETEISTLAASILLNIYRYPRTRACSWIPELIESLLTVMLHCCDKEGPLFPTLATLFYFFLQTQSYKTVIVGSFKFQDKMRQIKEKCERKVKMMSKVNHFHSYFSSYNRLPLPSMDPDWGLDLPNKPRIFMNSQQALKCILSCITQ